jgi:predicted amidophosphoribosyltransferase
MKTQVQIPKCDQCQQIRINGIVTHELNCPNQAHECFECETQIPKKQRYCEDCAEEMAYN